MNRIDRVRRLCLALPEAFEREAWGHATFRVGSGRGKMFCIAAADGSSTDWEEVAELIATAYCLIAPKRLAGTVTTPPSLEG